MSLLDASCRVALAGLIHDLGKFAQRANLDYTQEDLATHRDLYCPRHFIDKDPSRYFHTHVHSAYTALAFDLIEKSAPDLVKGDMTPFSGNRAGADCTDSLINAAAKHHVPETFIQWIIATADRIASGFERDEFNQYNQTKDEANFYAMRLRSLFEQVHLPINGKRQKDFEYAYDLKPLSAHSFFPELKDKIQPKDNPTAQSEYRNLWKAFSKALLENPQSQIPTSHRKNWSLWLDHFDSAWLTYTATIPSATAFGVNPDVSLYDHSKATAALATALWRWHDAHGKTDQDAIEGLKNRGLDWDENKFLLVQGDFFGIQNFVFAQGQHTNKESAKLLRGRSFYVSLITELAALKILETLQLPSTSQITNAAGKFLILAPNTPETIEKLQALQKEFNEWFIKNTSGVSGLGIAWIEASANDFVSKRKERNFSTVIRKLFESLEVTKHQRLDLVAREKATLNVDFSKGVSDYDDHLPKSSPLPQDQISVGKALVKHERLLILSEVSALRDSLKPLKLPIFGYHVAFTDSADVSGKFGELASTGALRRCWDFSINKSGADSLWNGYARRYINGYIPRFADIGEALDQRYQKVQTEEDRKTFDYSLIKPFSHIACEDQSREGDQYIGQRALMTLKGDVDNLGLIFQTGLTDEDSHRYTSFAKMASLSRQVNHFFSVYLPYLCQEKYPNTYTVFAGGDDFFMIGPWLSTQRLAAETHLEFKRYVQNPEIHFSAGLTMTKSDIPPRSLARMAENALENAKNIDGKNAVTSFGVSLAWDQFTTLSAFETYLETESARFGLSTGYCYSLFSLLSLAEEEKKGNPQASMWRSHLSYKTVRMAKTKGPEDQPYLTRVFLPKLVSAINEYGNALRIPLSNFFYKVRKN